MIAQILEDRCTGCGDCVHACPMDVFELSPPGSGKAVPVIARQADCQTCFLCELHCRADALYVDPDCERPAAPAAAEAVRRGLVGQYRRHSGWHEWAEGGAYPNEHWRMEEMFALARSLPPE